MQNGITRLFNAICYQQLGRALEHKDIEEDTAITHGSVEDEFDNNRQTTQTRKHSESLFGKSEFSRDPIVIRKVSDSVTQRILTENVDAVRQVYEGIINDKKNNLQRYKQAIGQLIAIIEQKKNAVKGITKDIDKLEQMKERATAKLESISLELKLSGLSEKEIKQHPDYTRCIGSYNDFNSTVMEKRTRIAELEDDIERAQQDIEHHKSNLTQLHQDLEKIKTEQSEAITDLVTAREKEEINAILADIKVD